MQQLKKIIRNTLLAIISVFALFMVILMLNGKYNFLGYSEVSRFSVYFPHKAGFFKNSVREEIIIKSLKTNIFNDSMYSINYGDSCNILLWIIRQNQNVSMRTTTDTIQKILKSADFAGVFYTYPDSKLTIKSKLFLHDFKDIFVSFDNCKEVQNIVNNSTCQYYYLKPGVIYLTPNGNKNYDIELGLNTHSDANFMVYTMNNKLYIFLLYYPYKIKISPNALLGIINLPLT